MAFLIANFAVKNAMSNLNENNCIVMARYPSVMRIGWLSFSLPSPKTTNSLVVG